MTDENDDRPKKQRVEQVEGSVDTTPEAMREQHVDGTALGEMMDGELAVGSGANAHGETRDYRQV